MKMRIENNTGFDQNMVEGRIDRILSYGKISRQQYGDCFLSLSHYPDGCVIQCNMTDKDTFIFKVSEE